MSVSPSRSISAPPPAGPFGPGAAALALALLTAVRLLYLPFHPFDLHPDEAQYWSWSRDLAWGYFSKPPVVAWLIAAATSLCGAGEACIRAPVPILHFATAMLIYGAGRRLYDARAGFLAALAFATLPGVWFSSTIVSTDPPLMTFWALGLYALVRLREAEGRAAVWWVALGLAVGFGLLSKYAMGFFAAALALWLALDRDARARLLGRAAGRRGLALAAVLGFLVYLPNLVWNRTAGFVTFAHTRANANLGADWFNPLELADFLFSQFGVFGPILFAALLWVVLRVRHWRADPRQRMLAAFVLTMLVPILVLGFWTRANANWAAAAYVAASVWVAGELAARGRQRWVTGSVALHVAVAVMVYSAALLMTGPGAYAGMRVPPWMDPYKRYEGWAELGRAVSELRARHPTLPLLVDDRKLMAALLYYVRPWPEDAYAWFPRGRVTDHFKLTRPFTGPVGADVLAVTRNPDPGALLARFRAHEKLAEIVTPIGTGRARRVQIFRATGFVGYKSPRP